mgnify:CR=1 FL=1
MAPPPARGEPEGMQCYPLPPEPPLVLFTADQPRRDLVGRRDLLRVSRGAFMALPPRGTPTWRVKELVTLARCEAVLSTKIGRASCRERV